MHNYSVNKYFGHFWQCWNILAESEEDAWNRAEKDGTLQYQSVYKEEHTESKGYVVDLDDEKRDKPITEETYCKWLKEAIDLGMVVTAKEYERACGLPFHTVW